MRNVIDNRYLLSMNQIHTHFLQNLHSTSRQRVLALALLLLLSGLRFSDGTVLMAISSDLAISDPRFNELIQYNLDSPLKVLLLKLLPAHILVIGLIFSLLAIMPAFGLLLNTSSIVNLSLISIFLTPALKIALQNIGLGDGLVIALVIVSCASRKLFIIALCFFLIGLWHPQQSFFIAVSYLLAEYCYKKHLPIAKAATIIISLICAAISFYLYKKGLGFSYSGRQAYLLNHLQSFFWRNLIYAPIAFAPLLLWFSLNREKPQYQWLLYAWILILAIIALMTTDVTRVLTLISLPIVLISAQNRSIPAPTLQKLLVFSILIQLIPAYSWSGLDFFLWPEFFKDLCKWKHWCW